jgi:hypothetical protein
LFFIRAAVVVGKEALDRQEAEEMAVEEMVGDRLTTPSLERTG